MKFRTELQLPPFPFSIGQEHQVGFLGSCFSENIGSKLRATKVHTFVNPYGTVFTPRALLSIVQDALNGRTPNSACFVSTEDWQYSFQYPSAVSAANEALLSQHIEQVNTAFSQQLKEADYLFVTLGTAWAYHHKSLGMYVANCHKVPQQAFEKKLLSYHEVCSDLQQLQEILHAHNPGLQIVYTVSPVKHIKDGIVENNRSKSVLLSAVHEVVEKGSAFYFPSYELVTEDLRDYRYYKKDLVHPNEQAIDYIWEQFEQAFFTTETIQLNRSIEKIKAAAAHRSLQPGKNQRTFAEKQLQRINSIEQQIGSGKFAEEKKWFESLRS